MRQMPRILCLTALMMCGSLKARLKVEMFDNEKNIPLDYEPPRPYKNRKWPPITPAVHTQIKHLYQNKICHKGEVKAFARWHGYPRWKISRYAQGMGWTAKQKKEPNWTSSELRILQNSAHHCPDVIQRRLAQRGYKRSLVGIVLKRKRMRCLQNINGQSAQQVALCLGEDIHFITRAIRHGLLKASRRIQERTPQQGGCAYLIKDNDVREFIINNVNQIDLRKVDKYWFVDLLANGK